MVTTFMENQGSHGKNCDHGIAWENNRMLNLVEIMEKSDFVSFVEICHIGGFPAD